MTAPKLPEGLEPVALPPDLEALMPEPAAFCEQDNPLNSYAFSWPGLGRGFMHTTPLFTADQVRAAILGATERAAKLAAELAYDAAIKYANGREVDFEQEVAAAIRGAEKEGAKGS